MINVEVACRGEGCEIKKDGRNMNSTGESLALLCITRVLALAYRARAICHRRFHWPPPYGVATTSHMMKYSTLNSAVVRCCL